MKLPGPDHPITIEANPRRVRVWFGGKIVADTAHALTLREGALAPVHYIPREDANMALLERTPHTTHCPYKGDANYFTVTAEGKSAENAVWTYEHPYPAVAAIEGRLAFYPNRIDAIEEIAT